MNNIPTISTIRPGQAERSEWLLWDGVRDLDDGGPVLVRIVLKLQRWILIQLELGDLVWLPAATLAYLLPTEPADGGEPHAEAQRREAEDPSASFAPLRDAPEVDWSEPGWDFEPIDCLATHHSPLTTDA